MAFIKGIEVDAPIINGVKYIIMQYGDQFDAYTSDLREMVDHDETLEGLKERLANIDL